MGRRMDWSGWITGLVLVLLGVLFLLDTTGVVDGVFSTWWPVLLILWGTTTLVRERGRTIPGMLILLLGIGFLLENLEVLGEGWLGRYWPVALIVVGVGLLFSTFRWRERPRPWTPQSQRVGSDWVDASVVMAGRKETVTSPAWRGGRANAVLGGVELDLREATPVPEGAVLHTTAFMGGVEIHVPEDWQVVLDGTPFLGGFEDHRRSPARAGNGNRPRLEIVGTAVLGGVEIKD